MSLEASIAKALRAVERAMGRSPKPRVTRAERRARISRGQLRRNAPATAPVPTSAPAPTLLVEEPVGIEVRGQPLPPPPVVHAPLERAVVLAAQVAPEKAAAAAELAAKKAKIESTAKWASPCKAIDADTGLQCGLMKGHTVAHRHARGAFVRVATEAVKRAVDANAWSWRAS